MLFTLSFLWVSFITSSRGDKIDKPGKKARKGKKNDKDSLATSKDDNKGKTSNLKEKFKIK